MVDGIANCVRVPIVVVLQATKARQVSVQWDSRESPGPTSEAELSCPSTRRVLTAGALALAVIVPAAEPVEHATETGSASQQAPPVAAHAPDFAFDAIFMERPSVSQRVSRATPRRVIGLRPAAPIRVRAVARPILRRSAPRPAHRAVVRTPARTHLVRRAAAHRTAARRHTVSRRVHVTRSRGSMSAVIDYARAQIGKNYVTGGDGPNGFDCSGFTSRAYARAGLRLPHSSGGQAARARTVSRSQARAGDLVVGPGHVGIYMGGGMMIDAGNHRVGVVYRHLYEGLHIERF
jgi:peptidoglycan DL-endopeptidase CwlO